MSTKHVAHVVMRVAMLCLLVWLPSLTTVTRAADSGAAAGTATNATPTSPPAPTPTPTSTSTSPPTSPPAAAAATTAATAGNAAGAAHGSAGAQPAGSSGADSIQLGTTDISGNRELPKLLYIVPWQRAQIGKFPGRPPNSLVDEALTPVDRAVFERQNRYYAALESSTESARSQGGTAPTPPAGASPRDEK